MKPTSNSTSRIGQVGRVSPFYPPPAAGTATPWRIDVYSARHELDRWQRYGEAASRSYASRGLAAVSAGHAIDVERFPTYFAEAWIRETDGTERCIGGIRIHEPDVRGDLPILEELTGHTDTSRLRSLSRELAPAGTCYGGGLWIDPEFGRSGVAADLARACIPMIAVLQARWCIAMTHQRILEAWDSLGWQAVAGIPPFHYPDERYRSQVILGGPSTWPADVARWASSHLQGRCLAHAGPRMQVHPMRTASREAVPA